MTFITNILIALIALLHLYIMWFEMFEWETRGPKIFKQFPKDLFKPTKAMAQNQGLYNGFLSVGLVYALMIDNPIWYYNIAMLFLAFVAIAGIFGGFTASKRILYIQAIPAIIAMILLNLI